MIEAAEPDFPQAEYEARLDRAQRAMHADGIDALLFTTEAEMRYFTGFRTLFWLSPTRPWFLVVPKTGKPIAIIPEIGAALMRATWIDDVRCWSSPHEDDDGVSLLADALRGSTRVGIPMALALQCYESSQLLDPRDEGVTALALRLLVDLYQSWDQSEPSAGYDTKATQYQDILNTL